MLGFSNDDMIDHKWANTLTSNDILCEFLDSCSRLLSGDQENITGG